MPSAIMGRARVTWDGTRDPKTIYEVWDFIGLRLNEVKERLRNIIDDFYAKEDRVSYLCNINEALNVAMHHEQTLNKVGNFLELEQLLKMPPNTSARPQLLKKALKLLRPYQDRTKITVVRLTETREIFQIDILKPLEIYCSSYVKLGIADDQFYKSLKSRTVKIRGILKNFEKISASFQQSLTVCADYFSDSHFSQELSLQFNCSTFSIMRIIPDLFQKLETVINTGQDWLRSDKVYLDHIQKEIENTQNRMKERAGDLHRVKLEYDQLFSMVKQKQLQLNDAEEDKDGLLKELFKLEAKKTKLEIELAAVAKTLRECREELRDLVCAERPSVDTDDVDSVAPDNTGHVHTNYKSRLCKDARTHNIKLDYIRKKKRYIERKILEKRSMLTNVQQHEADVKNLSKKLKASSRKKIKFCEDVSTQKGLLESLEHALKQRLRPTHSGSLARTLNNSSTNRSKTAYDTRKTSYRKKARSKRSEEISKAFRLVKNNIGYNWKDLARCLPYGEKKEMTEIDNEIKVIEYENQGQLKEQAYQSLLKWYSHVGRRASVELLSGALRDIDQNRLADSIEKETDTSETEHATLR